MLLVRIPIRKKRKKSDGNKNYNNSKKPKKDDKDNRPKCHFCKIPGHFKRECRKWQRKQQEMSNNQANVTEKDKSDIVAMVSEMFSELQIGMVTEVSMAAGTKSKDWWFDSGATVHVCNDFSQFTNYEPSDKDDGVLMGNNNVAKVLGKGCVEVQFTSGKKIILTNVLHVPKIIKNLISASLLCKAGVKAVLESDKLILTKSGAFVGKGYSCDGMFKLSINIINNNTSTSAYIVELSPSLWHMRLAHVNFGSIKFMSKHEMINYDSHVF